MDLLKLRTVQWITIIGSIAGVVSLLALWNSPYRGLLMALAIALPLATAAVELQKDRITIFFTGIRKYYRTFPVEKNTAIFSDVKNEYCYFGVSFASVLNSFRIWYGSPQRRANVHIRLLLVDPDADDVLEFQARYEQNLWDTNLTGPQRKALDDTIRRVKDSIALVIDTLATLPPSVPPIEVYFHKERVRKWMHIINDEVLYVGMLPLGNDGLQAPVIELAKESKHWRLFDYYYDEWESIFKTARQVKISGQP
jgi:hypothetical protein